MSSKPYKARGQFQKVVQLKRGDKIVVFNVSKWPKVNQVSVPTRSGMRGHHSDFADVIAGRIIPIVRYNGRETTKKREIWRTYEV